MWRPILTILCFATGMSFGRDAPAFSLDIRSSPENQLDVSLVIQQSSLTLKNSTDSLATDFSGIGFRLIDVPPRLPLQLGFAAGYTFIDQQVISGLNNNNLGGGYISFLSRVVLFDSGRWSSNFLASYSYLVAQNNSDTQKTRIRWHHTRTEVNINYVLASYLSTTLGGVYGYVDAKLSGSGDKELTVNLKTRRRTAGIVGLSYLIGNDQKVAVQFQRGYVDKFLVQFQRTF